MVMVYTVKRMDSSGRLHEQTYEGFCSYTPGKEHKIVAIAVFDGEPELWIVESSQAIEELFRYYRSEDGREPEYIRVYNKV